jgi:intracellular sulfur oxidation DsrE/DsrF family protein
MTNSPEHTSIVILVTSDGMGTSETSLQRRLIRTYLRLLDEHNMLPGAICFYTDGVKLVVRDSPVLGELKSLEAKGVHLVVCSTCLNHFGLADEIQVGVVGGMTDIIEAQWQAEKVITI